MEVISASHVNVEKKILNPYCGVCCSIVLFDVYGFKPFSKLVRHCYLLSMRWFSLEEERVMQQSSVSISLSF